jgi:hypothetical protein
MSISSTIMKIIIVLMFFYFPFPLFQIFIWFLVRDGFFDFLYSWPLVLSYLFFLLLTVLIHEFSNILRVPIFSLIFKERRCTRRFLRLVCIFEAPKAGLEGLGGMASSGIFFASAAVWHPESYRHEMQHVKDGVAGALLISVGAAAVPFAALVLKGLGNVYPPDVFPLIMALFPWAILWTFLVWLMFEFRAYRYADGLSFRETLQKLTLYAAEKKFGSAVFEGAVATLAMYWMSNVVVALFNNPPASFYHFIVVLVVSMATPIVLAVVCRLGFRRLHPEAFRRGVRQVPLRHLRRRRRLSPIAGRTYLIPLLLGHVRQGERCRGGNGDCGAFSIRRNASRSDIDFGVVALVALNNMFRNL